MQVPGLSGIVLLSVNGNHSLAVGHDGTLWAWGVNGHGQLGDGAATDKRTTPARLASLPGVISIAAGNRFSVAVRSDGSAWAWGYSLDGQLGDGSTATVRTTPVRVQGLTDVTRVAASMHNAVAVKKDGTVWTWGGNLSGQLGDGTQPGYTAKSISPVQALDLQL
ncbi:RCC1 domain-containing protein [Archangium lipolyticum]|uniref:RCC1 domain-containing protein n=1 Tax=Archangium lipolyticum TaxID=2970465 RepID=UPI0038990A37